jgi:hypothetical protein
MSFITENNMIKVKEAIEDNFECLLNESYALTVKGFGIPFVSTNRISGFEKLGYKALVDVRVTEDLWIREGDYLLWMHNGYAKQICLPHAYVLWVNGACTWVDVTKLHPFSLRQAGIERWYDIEWHLREAEKCLKGEYISAYKARKELIDILASVWLPKKDFFCYEPYESFYRYLGQGRYLKPMSYNNGGRFSRKQNNTKDLELNSIELVTEIIKSGGLISTRQLTGREERCNLVKAGDDRVYWENKICKIYD